VTRIVYLSDIAQTMRGTIYDALAVWQRCVDKGIFTLNPDGKTYSFGPNYCGITDMDMWMAGVRKHETP